MKRIFLTDNSQMWFNEESATLYKEATYHDGRNWISKATGQQWEHEALFVTKGGKFILNRYSNYQGTTETYEAMQKEDAILWLARNEYGDEAESFDDSGILSSYEA
ncbi:MAG: hypothetical protein WC297_03530 [Candidatus Paceibacterota bacterium]